MKSITLSLLIVSALGIAACESTSAPSGPRAMEVGTQSRTTVMLPPNDGVATSDAPYALEGSHLAPPAAATGTGYQAR